MYFRFHTNNKLAMEQGSCDGWTPGDQLSAVPFAHDVDLVSIEYPGYVVNIDKAMETLGGEESINDVHGVANKKISLAWRPQDKFCKPAYGELFQATSLVMKVRKRRKKGDKSGKSTTYKMEVLGSLGSIYKFQGMVDFQYLPMVKKKDNTYEDILDKITFTGLGERQEFFSRKVPLFIPPVSFSRVLFSEKHYAFKGHIKHKAGYKNPDENRPQNLIGTVREKRTIHTKFCNFMDPVDNVLTKEEIDRLHYYYNSPEDEQHLKELFEIRPIWSRAALNQYFKGSLKKMKYLLPLLAFYYLNGPWRCLWVRYGYDPKKHPEAKHYQTIDLRLRQVSQGNIPVKQKRIESLVRMPYARKKVSETPNIHVSVLEKKFSTSKEEEEGIDDSSYIFTPATVPSCRQMFYQAMDIKVNIIQKLFHENDGQETTCDERNGWFSPETLCLCRDVMIYLITKQLFPDNEVSFLEIAQDSIKKLKGTHVVSRVPKKMREINRILLTEDQNKPFEAQNEQSCNLSLGDDVKEEEDVDDDSKMEVDNSNEDYKGEETADDSDEADDLLNMEILDCA